MNTTYQKMSKIVDELFSYFLYNIGSDNVKLDLTKNKEGFELTLYSKYPPSSRKQVMDLERFLNPPERNYGMEEIYWTLAGAGVGEDSELHLLGQMLDKAEVKITEDDVNLHVFKKDD